MPTQNSTSIPVGSLKDYLAAGCDPLVGEINAQIAARYPFNTASYFRSFGRLPNYAAPRGYTEKIQWRKMFDRNPIFVTFSDKLLARDLARSRMPIIGLSELLWVGDDPAVMPLDDLRPPFIIKPNNRSAEIIMVRDAEDLDAGAVRERCRGWLRLPAYGLHFNEWAYGKTRSQIMVERLLSTRAAPADPIDFKIHVFSGKTRLIFRRDRRPAERGMYSPVWKPLKLDRWLWGRLDSFDSTDHPPPKNLERMIEIAEALAADIDYVRVDLYNIDGEIFFGEFSPCPYSGFCYWLPKGTECNPHPPRGPDDMLGKEWELPDIPWRTRMQNALIE